MSEISLARLSKALKSLESGYKPKPTELERDGIIQRFEYSLDLCWKTSKKVLLSNGIESDSPKNVMRELGQLGWIHDVSIWLDYIEKRNLTSHMYNEEIANQIFQVIGDFIKHANLLLETLKRNNK